MSRKRKHDNRNSRSRRRGVEMLEVYSTIKAKKPFWLPKFIWNKAVNQAVDALLGYAKVEKIGGFVAKGVVNGVTKAVNGKSASAVRRVCTVSEKGGAAFSKIAAAAKDRKITQKEQAEISASIGETIGSLVSQDEINAKFEEARGALLFL